MSSSSSSSAFASATSAIGSVLETLLKERGFSLSPDGLDNGFLPSSQSSSRTETTTNQNPSPGRAVPLLPATVYFIRHAESTANVAAKRFPKGSPEREEQYCSTEYFNAELSDHGAKTASEEVWENLRKNGFCPDVIPAGTIRGSAINIVLMSTLRRTLATAKLGVFDRIIDISNVDQEQQDGKISPADSPPRRGGKTKNWFWFAHDAMREYAMGVVHPCDYRDGCLDAERERYDFIDYFPDNTARDPIPENEPMDGLRRRIGVDFRLLLEEIMSVVNGLSFGKAVAAAPDEDRIQGGCGEEAQEHSMGKLTAGITSRSSSGAAAVVKVNIIVVSHSQFLSELFRTFLQDEENAVFANCEVRSVGLAKLMQGLANFYGDTEAR
ncbi:unnamed protein product [Amoebophrya sp. A120]|nr:unnamed protein product [Amoebophrya sp. A120]|eukprot:GSA120T00021034001.1